MIFLLNAFLSSARKSGVSSFPLLDPPLPLLELRALLLPLAPFRVELPAEAATTDIAEEEEAVRERGQ